MEEKGATIHHVLFDLFWTIIPPLRET